MDLNHVMHMYLSHTCQVLQRGLSTGVERVRVSFHGLLKKQGTGTGEPLHGGVWLRATAWAGFTGVCSVCAVEAVVLRCREDVGCTVHLVG